MLVTLFEDHSILAVDKPSGLPSHSLNASQTSCESILAEDRPGEKFYLAHRLDTGTSGVLIFAKNEQTFNDLREQFKLKKVKKHYLAWVEKTLSRETLLATFLLPHTLDWPLAHHAKNKKKMIPIVPGKKRGFRGKPIPATTIIHGVTEDSFARIPCLLFQIEILTGVMHQIRVHLATLGFPLIGDLVYERVERDEQPRMGLHAQSIGFNLSGYQYEIESVFESPIVFD